MNRLDLTGAFAYLSPRVVRLSGRVESRLDAEDEDELRRLAEFRKDWQRRRNELVTSIEKLLTRLKGAA